MIFDTEVWCVKKILFRHGIQLRLSTQDVKILYFNIQIKSTWHEYFLEVVIVFETSGDVRDRFVQKIAADQLLDLSRCKKPPNTNEINVRPSKHIQLNDFLFYFISISLVSAVNNYSILLKGVLHVNSKVPISINVSNQYFSSILTSIS